MAGRSTKEETVTLSTEVSGPIVDVTVTAPVVALTETV
jgi:hypothetical protein